MDIDGRADDGSMAGSSHEDGFPNTKRRAFLMLRVSGRRQAGKYGPDAQRAEGYEGAKECPIPIEFSHDREAFWIETASGWNRKQFTVEMAKRLEEFGRGEWDVLVFPRVDRETRFLAGSFEALNQLLRTGVPIYFAKHHLLLREGDSEAFDTYFDLVKEARAYIKVLKANIEGGKLQAMAAGRIPSGFGPKGLTGYDWRNGCFVKNSVAPAVEFMLRRYLDGYSESSIMLELKKRGFLTKAGKFFAQSTVSKVLHHARWYAGFITYRGKEFSGLIDPMITEDEASRIKERLSRSTTWRTAYGRAHWWTGRVLCGLCLRRVSLSKSHGCRCGGRDNRLPEPCPAPSLGFEAFQHAVSEGLRRTLAHPEAIFEQVCEQMEGRRKEVTFLTGELQEKRRRLADVHGRLDRLSRQHELGLLTEIELVERSRDTLRDKQDIEVRVRELETILRPSPPATPYSPHSLVTECLECFSFGEDTPERRLMAEVATIATEWIDELGMPGTLPHEESWTRLAEKMDLGMLIYPPEEEDIQGQRVKATVRITGHFPLAATGSYLGAGVETATVSTPSLQHELRRRHVDGGD